MPIVPAPGTPGYEYQMAHWNDDIRAQSIAGCAVMVVVATIAVVVRLVSQKLYSKGWSAADYLIVAAWFIAMGIAAEAIISFKLGFGLHQLRVILMDENPPYRLVKAFENGSFVAYAWVPCLAFIKLSLLMYYHELFQVHQKWLKITTWIMFAYVVAWTIGSLPVLLFQCIPIQYFWLRMALMYGVKPPGLHGHCLPQLVHLAVPSITSTFSDCVILIIPIIVLWNLAMPLRRKIGLGILFGMGTFIVGTGIVRIYFVFHVSNTEDVTWNDIGTVEWTVVETCMAILCASIPPSTPLLSAGLRSVGRMGSRGGTAASPGPMWTWRTREKTRRTDSLDDALAETIPMDERTLTTGDSHIDDAKFSDLESGTRNTSKTTEGSQSQ